ncbi:putative UDP-glucuronosyltransferase ugt-47 [Ditylenchus destructor]|uniref:UDP-glucuronosyltransferase ugt-47 n=1 Tax=Ditylenchus destructor TaxID=166010 RepID=A0AAD4MM95_9BILA|nr:putative UDP-glucuronosyltransferase ugt-47 [Ditylenchus destructor]
MCFLMYKVAIILSLCFSATCGFKILVFSPTISKSHMISNGRIADTLAADGHNVHTSLLPPKVTFRTIENICD